MINSSTSTPSVETPVTPPANLDEALRLAQTIAQAADERKGGDIRILKVDQVSYLADYFVIVTGFSVAQVRAICRTVEATVEEALGRLPLRTEGQGEGRWVLQDYGDVIFHAFMPEEREFYDLEAFWGHAETVDLNPGDQHPMT
jgi:ribosome-associated protein